jgi:hypothetical protein
MNGLIIKQEFLDRILSGRKDWELRGSNSRIRGPIALIESGSGLVVGRATLIDVIGPLSLRTLKSKARHLGCNANEVSRSYSKTFAWVLKGASRLPRPVAYQHPQGAVIWVKLNYAVTRKMKR